MSDTPNLFTKMGLCKLIKLRTEFVEKENKKQISKWTDCTDENVDELLRVENPSIQEAIFQLFSRLSTVPFQIVWTETEFVLYLKLI
jgi:hypothetical protein